MPYSSKTLAILLSMVLAGSLRIVAVKLLYQLGLESPYFVTLLYLTGQSLSLVVDFMARWFGFLKSSSSSSSNNEVDDQHAYATVKSIDDDVIEYCVNGKEDDDDDDECFEMSQVSTSDDNDEDECTNSTTQQQDKIDEDDDLSSSNNDGPRKQQQQQFTPPPHHNPHPPQPRRARSGSETGLTSDSDAAISYIHSIPTWLKPAIPGFFNLMNSIMRWGCLIYVPASTAEMLISGLELILSTMAARIIRKRIISNQRWGGVVIVTIGLIVVRLSDIMYPITNNDEEEELMIIMTTTTTEDILTVDDGEDIAGAVSTTSSLQAERLIGDALIVGQCIMSVLQDISEEIFMHESDLAPTALLGWEGLFGLFFGILLYAPLSPIVDNGNPWETWETIRSSTFTMTYIMALVPLFTITGMLNIFSTAVTSSMTRNVWKNFRTAVVWSMSLVIFYVSGNENIGEGWHSPSSFVVLVGFAIMLCGICLYYHLPSNTNTGTTPKMQQQESTSPRTLVSWFCCRLFGKTESKQYSAIPMTELPLQGSSDDVDDDDQ